NQDLTFNKLEQVLIQGMNIEKLNSDILKTLELYSDKTGFNVAAELLADKNSFMGIDVIRFGENIDEIMERKVFEYISILDELEQMLQMFRRYYQYEKIEGTERNVVDKIPEKAFREAIANALVHRMWDVKASIKVSMYSDRIEINSPGGLPEGINEEEYLNGQISILRNTIIGNVFFRLKYIEKFGTGIMRINYAYKDAIEKPKYKVFLNSIQVVLPVFTDMKDLSTEEKMIWKLLREKDEMTRSELAKATGLGKDKTIRVLNGLLDKNVITRRGAGRGVKYRVN
ncbi:AAA family ATPase, partial [Ruminococcus sp. B05]